MVKKLALVAISWLLWIGCACAQIGTPQSLGTTQTQNSGSTFHITTTNAILSGDLVVVPVCIFSNVTVSSVSDGTNTYTKAQAATGTGSDAEIWYKANASAVSSSSSLTVTLSGALMNGEQALAVAGRVSGAVTVSPLDKTVAGTATTGSVPSISSGTLSQATEILYGSLCATGDTIGFTEDSGFTNLITFNASSPGDSGQTLGYKIVSSTASVTYHPSNSTGDALNIPMLTTFKGTTGGGASCNGNLLHVGC